jgi:hypothetical protein
MRLDFSSINWDEILQNALPEDLEWLKTKINRLLSSLKPECSERKIIIRKEK